MIARVDDTPIDLMDPRALDGGLFPKVLAGKEGWAKLNAVDSTRFASMAASLATVKLKGVLGATGSVVGGAVDVVADFMDVARQRADLEKTLGIRLRSDVAHDADAEDSSRRVDAVGRGLAVTATTTAAALGVAAIGISGPLGWIAAAGASIVTGMLTSMGYDAAFTSAFNDSMGLSGKLLFAQTQGVEIPKEAAFAAWAAAQPQHMRTQIENRLKQLTNGDMKYVSEALQKNKTEALATLMEEYDAVMKMDANLNLDMGSSLSGSEQLAAKMNNRVLDRVTGQMVPEFLASDLITGDQLEAVLRLNQMQQLKQTGVTVADPSAPQEIPPTGGSRTR